MAEQNEQVLADAIAKGISEGMAANAPPRKKTMGEYIRTAKSASHPEGLANMHKLTRECFLVGNPITEETITNHDIDNLNAITHNGRYFDRKLEVIVRQDGATEQVEIRFPSKTADQRFEMKDHFRNLTDMLDQIMEFQRAEDADADEIKAIHASRRVAQQVNQGAERASTFGNNKAFKEAKQRAEATE